MKGSIFTVAVIVTLTGVAWLTFIDLSQTARYNTITAQSPIPMWKAMAQPTKPVPAAAATPISQPAASTGVSKPVRELPTLPAMPHTVPPQEREINCLNVKPIRKVKSEPRGELSKRSVPD